MIAEAKVQKMTIRGLKKSHVKFQRAFKRLIKISKYAESIGLILDVEAIDLATLTIVPLKLQKALR